ncbi:MAG: hypothetical protein LBI35_01490 [Burkholderiales bacterium]|jgi:hypothetical protein|nr:hypothetical protein [Burkholderiales bacterium]
MDQAEKIVALKIAINKVCLDHNLPPRETAQALIECYQDNIKKLEFATVNASQLFEVLERVTVSTECESAP